MEYATYILVILGIMAVCHYLLRRPGKSLIGENGAKLSEKFRNHPVGKQGVKNSKITESAPAAPTLRKETLTVPTPWGWPGHVKHTTGDVHSLPNTEEVHDVSESLHRFVDRLMSEKQTVENRDYLLKKDASLRALLEDRYGRVLPKPEAGNRKVKPSASPGPRVTREVKTPWGW